jgi:FkbM family methyltransferase
MDMVLSKVARVLRRPLLPRRVAYHLWKWICSRRSGEAFFFEIDLFGREYVYGGVCGFTDQALFGNLETFESETGIAVKQVLGATAIGPAPVVLDVGANNGQWLLLLKSLAPDAEVHCFEPFSELARFLESLIARNSFQHVRVNQMLVGDSAGVGVLHFQKGVSDLASTLADLRAGFDSSREVTSTTIDNYVRDHGVNHVDLIKVDVELGELEVLRGAVETLQRLRPYVVLEVLYTTYEGHLSKQRSLADLFRRLGYVSYHIGPEGALTRRADLASDPQYKYNNFLVAPGPI